MSSLPLELNLSSSVSRCLHEVLPDASISEVKVVESLPSVLILRINQILAAFAFGRDDATYEALYSGFKKHFLSKGDEWNSLDVAFVYCLPPSSPPSQSFCSRVETDVYFCRKFVVPLGVDISSSLLRLPFLPLSPLSGSPLRPPSAQTLLRRSSVPAELARSLVAQYTRGAQGILADCLDKKFGEPAPLSESAVDAEHKNERTFGASTLESLSIQNFRAYRKKRTFAFGSAVTVLYGPNGFGKTSFFDALDFAVTGGIGRLPTTITNQAFAKAAKHLDSGTEDSIVSLTFKRGEQTHSVVRNLSDPKHATMDSKVVERKDVLSKLTGGEATTADRVDNFVSLFRATHLFSQESQELTRDFEVKCELSSDLVSRMLAFEDYVNGIKKTSEVQGHIKTTIDRATSEVKRLEALAEKDREELTRLEGLAAAHANPGAIESELLLLRQDIANTGIAVASDVIDTPSLRGWRAQLESRIAQASGQAVQLSKAIGDLQQVRSLGVELSAVQSTVKQVSESLAETERALATVEGLHRTADSQHSQLKAGEGMAQRAFDSLNWIAQVKPEFDRLIGERTTLESALRTAGQQDTSLRNEESATAAARQAAETALSNLAGQVLAGSSRLQALQSVGRQKPEVNAANERLKQLVETERACVASIAQARLQLEQLSVTRQSSLVEMARAERDVATRDAEVTEVRSLLAQLRGHVTEGTCLLCGVDHGSAEALLARIDARLIEERPISEARERLTRHRSDVTQLTEKEAGLQQALNDSQERQEGLRSERQRLERLLSEFSYAAAALGIVVPANGDWPEEVLNLTTRQEEQALAILSNQREGAVQSRNAAIKASDDAKAAFAANAAAMGASKGNLDRTNQAIGRLVADPRRGTIDLETAPKELHAMLDAAAEKLQTIKTEVAAALTIADQRKAEVARKAQEVGTAKKALEEAQRRTGDITTGISALTSSLAQMGLNSDSSGQSVTELLEANSVLQVRLVALKERTMNLEIALDEATTAAALASLRTSLGTHVNGIDVAKQERTRHEPWAKYFDAVYKLLTAQQSSATDQFTREYGPRTAVIQRRLRPVYGFGDLEVSSKGGAIAVHVTRNGEALRPTDYFSQSQLQTLVLGLFLTACSSQTWSAFSSVMMDDPVTHFDDLNTYALLDLISGLLQSPDGAPAVRHFDVRREAPATRATKVPTPEGRGEVLSLLRDWGRRAPGK